jgi:hypothetical protein
VFVGPSWKLGRRPIPAAESASVRVAAGNVELGLTDARKAGDVRVILLGALDDDAPPASQRG